MYTGPNPDEIKRLKEEQENDELCADYLARHPEPVISPEDLRECGPEIVEFEAMIATFESTHSLVELHSLVDLSIETSRVHPIREPARLALIPIIAKRDIIKKETNISVEKYEELYAECRRLDRAVGFIHNNSKVIHDR